MKRPEFVALQVSVLVRSDELRSPEIQAFMNRADFQASMQEAVAGLIRESLEIGGVSFDEIIISLDRPPERAKPVERTASPGGKPSRLGRLFGKK